MKVIQVNAVYANGSTGVIVKDLHNLCLEKDIESYVAYSTSSVSANEIINGYQIGKKCGKLIHAVLSRINGKQAYFSVNATVRLIRYIKKIKPDVVCLHNLHSNFVNLNKLLRFLAKEEINTVVVLHDCWFYTGGCFHYSADNCYKWLEKCGDCPKKSKDTPAYLMDASSEILADRKKYLRGINNLTVVGVSEWIASEARRTFLSDKKIVTIHNGIDTDFFVPTESDFREKNGLEDKFLILALANKWLKPVNKDTFDYVVNNLPDDCLIVMLGCNREQSDNLPTNILPIEFISDKQQLKALYTACDVFANCTREESFSLINVEVQACGTPVVTYRNTGAQETVDNICSFSVENGNEKDFLEAILKVKSVGKTTFSAQCRKHVENKFNCYKNYEKYIELYKETCNN